MQRTSSPLLTPSEQAIIHGVFSSRVHIGARLALEGITSPEAFEAALPPAPIDFGRADHARIQKPIGPANPPLWRVAVLGGVITAAVVIVGIQLLPVAVEGMRTIVRAL